MYCPPEYYCRVHTPVNNWRKIEEARKALDKEKKKLEERGAWYLSKARPKLEVELLMGLLHNSLRTELKELKKTNIKLETIGDLSKIPLIVRKFLKKVCEETKDNDLMTLTLALSYGSRDEIINSVKEIADKVKNNIISPEKVDQSTINEHLYSRFLPPVDLLIRTSGEKRISNFLLWHIAYAELYFTKTLWPDFSKKNLLEALINFNKRERRFGKTSEQLTN